MKEAILAIQELSEVSVSGFAVVAAELRNLAESAETSAKEISQLNS